MAAKLKQIIHPTDTTTEALVSCDTTEERDGLLAVLELDIPTGFEAVGQKSIGFSFKKYLSDEATRRCVAGYMDLDR